MRLTCQSNHAGLVPHVSPSLSIGLLPTYSKNQRGKRVNPLTLGLRVNPEGEEG